MAYAEIPRDVTKIQRKVMAGLTKRQLLCFCAAGCVGFPLYFIFRKPLGSTTAAYIMVFTMMPAMLFAFYEKNGLPLEQYLRYMFQVMFFRAKQRPYRTNNIYDQVYYDILLEKEVKKIVQKAIRGETEASEANSGKLKTGQGDVRKARAGKSKPAEKAVTTKHHSRKKTTTQRKKSN